MKKMLIIASLLISGFANAESEILPPDLKVWIGYGYTYDSYGGRRFVFLGNKLSTDSLILSVSSTFG